MSNLAICDNANTKQWRTTNYILDRTEQDNLTKLVSSISFENNSRLELLVGRAEEISQTTKTILPRLDQLLSRLKDRDNPLGLLVVENLPQVNAFKLEATLGSLLGRITKYQGEGNYIIQIKERISRFVDRPSFQNSREFYLHTDLSYASEPPEILVMHSINNKSENGGNSLFCDAYAVVDQLDTETINQLQKAQFSFPVPKHYTGNHTRQFPIITLGNKNKIRFRRDALASSSRLGQEAVMTLIESIDKSAFELFLKEQSMVFVNNHTFLHGRTGFQPSTKSQGFRHLNRLYITL